jgi:hypothetical protein
VVNCLQINTKDNFPGKVTIHGPLPNIAKLWRSTACAQSDISYMVVKLMVLLCIEVVSAIIVQLFFCVQLDELTCHTEIKTFTYFFIYLKLDHIQF